MVYDCKCRSVQNCDVKLKVEIYGNRVILQILQYDTTRRFTLDLQNLNHLIAQFATIAESLETAIDLEREQEGGENNENL